MIYNTKAINYSCWFLYNGCQGSRVLHRTLCIVAFIQMSNNSNKSCKFKCLRFTTKIGVFTDPSPLNTTVTCKKSITLMHDIFVPQLYTSHLKLSHIKSLKIILSIYIGTLTNIYPLILNKYNNDTLNPC